MARHPALSWPLMLALCALAAAPQSAAGQEAQDSPAVVRFFRAAWSPPREVDAASAPVLRRRVSLDLTGASLGAALREITRQADLELVYSARVVPLDRPVWLRARELTVAAALTGLLAGLPVDVSVTVGGGLALVPRTDRAPAAWLGRTTLDSGAVIGRITERASGSPVAGATVTIEGFDQSTTTGSDGRYRIDRVPAGTHLVRARYIGYSPASVQVTVKVGEEATVDITLERSAQVLNQLVVTGTFVPTEVKAVPTPVSVIDEEDIALLRPQTVQELFRQAVPGAVGWDYSSSPYNTPFSVRGASTLTAGTPSLKIFIDGVEAAAAGFSQVDPSSIARMEVIRGPQAAAIYGSEAIGGVIQIFTKRGDPALERPQVSGEAAIGLVQTPYTGHDEVLRQEYKGSVRGGDSGVGYYLGAGYSRLGDWLPGGELSSQSSPSAHGGLNFTKGILGVDISGRYYSHRGGNNLFNPLLLQSGFAPFSRPSFQSMQTQNQTVGVRVSLMPAGWWRSTATAGIDRFSYNLVQDRPRLTTPADTLLLASDHVETRTSIGITSSVEAALDRGIVGSLTLGADHWTRPVSDWFAFNAVTTTGTITTAEGGAISATRIETSNTGYFAQAQIGFRDILFLTAGVRAEQNSEFGDSLKTPLLPRVGLTFVQPVGAATLKLRSSWGRAIRAPSPGRKLGFVSPTAVQLSNPELGPERQQGWDAGIDLVIDRASLGLTYYRQVADNLADAVVLATIPTLTQQFQNVGQVSNSGVEVEGTLAVGPLALRAQYSYIRARIRQLSPTYGGDLAIGDEPLLNPSHTAGASVSVTSFAKTTMTAGVVYVGSWTYYDNIALFRCAGGTGPCRASFRDYHLTYPDLVKLNLGVSRQLTPLLTGFLAVDNLTNNDAYEANNLLPVRGRTTTAGFRIQN